MNIRKSIACGSIVVSVLLGAAGGAFASDVAKEIKAILDSSFNIVYNGKQINMKDANGNAVYPIIYNGSTYVPLRAVSDIFNENVTWDGAKTVYIGQMDNESVNLTNLIGAGNTYCWKITDPSALTVKGDTAEATYSSGIERKIWNGASSSEKFTLVPMDVGGKKTLTFTAWSDIAANMLILDEKGNVIASFENPAGSVVKKEIDITGYSKIAFGANTKGNFSLTQGSARFFDPIVK